MQTILVKPEHKATDLHTINVRRTKFRVAVSGFGPFRDIPVNPSWECLKPLHGAQLITTQGTQVIVDCTEVAVTYRAVEDYTEEVHSEQVDEDGNAFNYDLHLHIGVSARQSLLLLERRARRFGYKSLDVNDCSAPCKPDDPESSGFGWTYGWDKEDLPEALHTILPLYNIKSKLSRKWGDRIQLSSDPGLYLCEYMYYSSLANAERMARQSSTAQRPVLFLHIPLATDQRELEDTTEFVKDLICTLVDDLQG